MGAHLEITDRVEVGDVRTSRIWLRASGAVLLHVPATCRKGRAAPRGGEQGRARGRWQVGVSEQQEWALLVHVHCEYAHVAPADSLKCKDCAGVVPATWHRGRRSEEGMSRGTKGGRCEEGMGRHGV